MMRLLHAPGKIPLLSEVALIIALAWMISGWLLPADAPESSGLPLRSTASSEKLPELSALVRVPLFGKARVQVQPTSPVAQGPRPITLSPLHIKLLGTVVSKTHAAAIIAPAQGGEQRVYFVGDSIQPGVILQTVEAEAIVVERGGKLERISLEQGVKLTATPMQQTSPTTSPATSATRTPAKVTQKKMRRDHLQKQLQNFPALLSQARVIPHMSQGKPAGFTISDIVPGSLYQQAGLQNGDIILSVNGKQITGAKQAMSMYQALQSAAAIDLELVRAGQIRQIHYDIR